MHTNPNQKGQVYIPEVNWAFLVGCIAMCLIGGSPDALAGAYGITVTSTFVITTILLWTVLRRVWRWHFLSACVLITPMFMIDILFWCSNLQKLFPLGCVQLFLAAVAFGLMRVHWWGRQMRRASFRREARDVSRTTREHDASVSLEESTPGAQNRNDPLPQRLATISAVPSLVAALRSGRLSRSGGVEVFLTPELMRVPRSLAHLAQERGALPSAVVLLHVIFEDLIPCVLDDHRSSFEVLDSEQGVFSVILRFGYAEPLTDDRFQIRSTLRRLAAQHVAGHPELTPLVEDPDPEGMEDERVTFVFNRTTYKARLGREDGFCARVDLYNLITRFARSPSSFFGLSESRTLEVPVVRLL